jgi:1-acyl-sn-glycerol-3-phosphate acyltransferase
MFDPMFVPPRHNAALFWLANALLPRLAPLFGKAHEVRVQPECLARLEALRPHRALLCPNHPTETDPIVLFWLSRLYRQPFNYLATRETLEGPRGRLLNQLGVYSVIRGFPDRESLRMTRRLLAEQDRKVVIFPEGNIYELNDQLLAFQTGVAQMGFWALDDLQKAGRPLSLPLVPIALKYCCLGDPAPAIEQGLRALERALGLPPVPALGRYQRLRRAGGEVLARLEREEGLDADPAGDLDPRIAAVRQRVLERVAQAMDAELDPTAPPATRLHDLFNTLKGWVGVLPDDAGDYEERRYRHRLEIAAPLFTELHRLQNFIAVTGNYVAAQPTAERFLEVLGCLQWEVFGKVRHRAPLSARLRIAPPIPLELRYQEYRENKRAVVAAVTREMQQAVWSMLQEMTAESTPIALGA